LAFFFFFGGGYIHIGTTAALANELEAINKLNSIRCPSLIIMY